MNPRLPAAFAAVLLASSLSYSQQPQAAPPKEVAGIPVNYDESKTGEYTLPDPLVLSSNGKRVRDTKTWTTQRRPELLRLFEQHQFGRVPPSAPTKLVKSEVFDSGTPVMNGKPSASRSRYTSPPSSMDPKPTSSSTCRRASRKPPYF